MSRVLHEALQALQMPPDQARAWLLRVRAFCKNHGGEPRYAALMKLLDESVQALDRERR